MRPLLRYGLVSRVLGLLLLAAAGLKVYGLAFDPLGPGGSGRAPWYLSDPRVQVALVGLEFVLALWLLWGKHAVGSWVLALAAFTAFLAINVYLVRVGEVSCGCFGKLPVKPWTALAIDAAALGALLLGRPDLTLLWSRPRATLARGVVTAAGLLAAVTALLALPAGWAYFSFGSVEAALAYLRGERISVQPALVDVGPGATGDLRETTVELVNRTDHAVRVIGGTRDCSCTVADDLPLTIPAKEWRTIRVKAAVPRGAGSFTREVRLLADDNGLRVVTFRMTGRVTGPAQKPEIAIGK
jgi:hypothetical protein